MSTLGQVHVGDVGTIYRAELKDDGKPFDPTAATTAELIFKNPNGVVITKDATVVTSGTGAKTRWFLQYIVLRADLGDGLHEIAGTYSWQGHLVFPDDSEFFTSIETYKVDSNLE